MKKKLRIGIICVLAAALAVSAFFLIRQALDYKKGSSDYEEAKSLVQAPELRPTPPQTPQSQAPEASGQPEAPVKPVDPNLEALLSMDLSVLQQINPDVVGWIEIPGTVVSYPILQTDNNSYYLNKTWRKDPSSVGSIFLECQNRADLSQFNTLIYGHNMRDGSMFSNLKDYQDLEYWKAHPTIYVVSGGVAKAFDVYAAYVVGTWEITYGLELNKPEVRQEFIDLGLKKTKIDTGITPTIDDSILTLSTCTGTGRSGSRWVVQAVCRED